MAKIRRANVVLEVKDDQVERFLNQGYDVIDNSGNVLQRSVPRDVGTLTKIYIEQTAKIEQLENEIKKLKEKKKSTAQKQEKQEPKPRNHSNE